MEWGVGPGAVCHMDTDARQGSLEGMLPGPVRFQAEATRYLAGFLDRGEDAQRVQVPRSSVGRDVCRIRSVIAVGWTPGEVPGQVAGQLVAWPPGPQTAPDQPPAGA